MSTDTMRGEQTERNRAAHRDGAMFCVACDRHHFRSEGEPGCEHPAIAAEKIDHPAHYNAHPSGVECVDIAEHYNFNLGNCIKYVWRAGIKSKDPLEDLKKAAWYINREIERLSKVKP